MALVCRENTHVRKRDPTVVIVQCILNVFILHSLSSILFDSELTVTLSAVGMRSSSVILIHSNFSTRYIGFIEQFYYSVVQWCPKLSESCCDDCKEFMCDNKVFMTVKR